MKFYEVRRYFKHTGEYFDTICVKSTLNAEATIEQLNKEDCDFIYKMVGRANIPTVDSDGVHW